ncbi:hypothetical protein Cantr_06633 [Candida viswanathii]|uniref:Uncharacterized protein n=1 Tax=Candida viswanathii TaxID=5486 RepID=A0A367XXW9_9ASCO|nr:hypothetical protein Cantr_06633 [Candida viswanathii]
MNQKQNVGAKLIEDYGLGVVYVPLYAVLFIADLCYLSNAPSGIGLVLIVLKLALSVTLIALGTFYFIRMRQLYVQDKNPNVSPDMESKIGLLDPSLATVCYGSQGDEKSQSSSSTTHSRTQVKTTPLWRFLDCFRDEVFALPFWLYQFLQGSYQYSTSGAGTSGQNGGIFMCLRDFTAQPPRPRGGTGTTIVTLDMNMIELLQKYYLNGNYRAQLKEDNAWKLLK